jgi:alkylated DNA repair dioxygenase AlkB
VLDETAPIERVQLDEGSWVDVVRGLVRGADGLYAQLVEDVAWSQGRVFRYDHHVDEPRLGAWCANGRSPVPVLTEAQRLLGHRYRVAFDGFALAWYRDGRDGVAFHRDRELRYLDDTVIGVLTLGARRPFLVRPRANRFDHGAEHGGATHDLAPSSGDLLVMGGRCQADWEHAVPQVGDRVGGRVSVQWRWTSRAGRPVQGASYRAPRRYGRR